MLTELMHASSLEDAPAYSFLNSLHVLLAENRSTGGAYSLVYLEAHGEFGTPYHVHHAEDEAFYVLGGEFTFVCDGKKTVLGAGGYIFLPRGVPHGFRCNGGEDPRLLILVSPGGEVGFVGMMLEMSVPVKDHVMPPPTPPDFTKLAAVCKKNDIDIVGPLPE